MYFIAFAAAVGTILARHYYRALDFNSDLLLVVILAMFLFPGVLLFYVKQLAERGRDFRGSARTYRMLLAGTLILPAVLVVNGALDNSAPEPHTTTVLRKWTRHGRYNYWYVAQFRSWRPGHNVEELEVTTATYVRLEPGKPAIIEVRSGALGIPWAGGIIPRVGP